MWLRGVHIDRQRGWHLRPPHHLGHLRNPVQGDDVSSLLPETVTHDEFAE